jgi:hypothetical protein
VRVPRELKPPSDTVHAGVPLAQLLAHVLRGAPGRARRDGQLQGTVHAASTPPSLPVAQHAQRHQHDEDGGDGAHVHQRVVLLGRLHGA